MERPVSKDNGGFTLIELVISTAIMFIVFLGLTGTVMTALEFNIQNALLDEAVSVGETKMNELRSLPFDNIVSDATGVDVARQVRGFNVSYHVTTAVGTPAADIRQVTMAVTWTRHGKTRSHNYSSIVRNR